MPIRIPKGWEIPESAATPEAVAMGRRRLLLGGAGLVAAGGAIGLGLRSGSAGAQTTTLAPLPATRNPRYEPGREITPEREAISYNNYYEFGTSKSVSAAAQRLPLRPWTVKVEGMVEKPEEFDIDALIRAMPLEERVYRFRCVEAWAMTVVWTGFPLAALLQRVNPLGSAKYVRFETAAIPGVMPGLRQSWYPWPYVEGCTIAEASHDLSFMVVGAYGKQLPPQNGGPLRVHFPWKYGFKAGKSLTRIVLTDQRPKSFWEAIQASEYGFWANVNPEVAHPRWSQASERLLGSGERVPTRIFNGYGEFVAGLYSGLQGERLWA